MSGDLAAVVEAQSRTIRRLQRQVWVLGAVLLLTLGVAAGKSSKTVQAGRFEVVGADGVVTAVLGTTDAGTGLTVYDGDAVRAVVVRDGKAGRMEQGPLIAVSDATGPRVALADDGKERGVLVLNDQARIRGTLLESGAGIGMMLSDDQGAPRVALFQHADDVSLKLRDKRGKTRAELRHTEVLERDLEVRGATVRQVTEAATGLLVSDPQGRIRTSLGWEKSGPAIRTLDSKRKPSFAAP